MDRLKVACQMSGALNIVCIIGSFPGLYFLSQLNSDGLALLITFDVMLFCSPIFLMLYACKTACTASICNRPFSWKKTMFHSWVAYNIVFGVGLAIYSLYALFNLGSVSSLEENDKYIYYLYMKISMPLSVLFCIKMVVITMYYVKRVHNEPTESSAGYRDKPLRNVHVHVQPLYNNDN